MSDSKSEDGKETKEITLSGSVVQLQNPHAGEAWEKLLKTGKHSDVTLILDGGEKLKLHRLVLAAQSPTLAAQLLGKMKESTETDIKLEGVNVSIFKQMIEFIYTGKASVDAGQIMELMRMCDYYGVDSLRAVCAKAVANMVTPSTVGHFLNTALQFYENKLYDECYKYVLENAEECFKNDDFLKALSEKEFIKLLQDDKVDAMEVTLFRAVVRWGKLRVKPKIAPTKKEKAVPDAPPMDGDSKKAEPEDDGLWDMSQVKEVIKDLMPHVRFGLMSSEEIMDTVQPYEVVPESLLFQALLYLMAKNKPASFKVNQRVLREKCLLRGGTLSGTWNYGGPADMVYLTVNKRVALLALGAHIPIGRITWDIGVWRGGTRLVTAKHEYDNKTEYKGHYRLKLPTPVILEPGTQYTIAYLQRSPNTPYLSSATPRQTMDGVEFRFQSVSNNQTGWSDNGTRENSGQIPCLWWKPA